MKMKRIISLAIALLLVCGMPVSAFAGFIDENPDGEKISVSSDQTLHINNGTVTTNDGMLIWNHGTVEDNNHNILHNYGTVEDNNKSASVSDNSNTVVNNNGNVSNNSRYGTVTTNNGTVDYNYGTVATNSGTVDTNYGTVGKTDENGNVVDGTGNFKAVTTNLGTVTTNESSGVVVSNGTSTMDNRADAKVGINKGKVSNNWGIVGTNSGEVDTNYEKSVVEINADNCRVNQNAGKVITNNGTVSNNSSDGTVEINNGSVDNSGTVDINNGTVSNNGGTVNTNNITGTVTNFDGTVGKNYGTVIDKTSNDKTTYGVQVDGTLFQKNEGEDFDLTQFTKAGYELTGYTQNYDMQNDKVTLLDSPITVNVTSYTADCPNILTLIWRALTGKSESAGDGAGYFGPGCTISVNGKQYILVEIKDGDYYLASCDEYTKEQLSDMDALLASLLTEEQLDCVTGAAEVLNAEQAELFFGGGSHIVFPCSKYLIFS